MFRQYLEIAHWLVTKSLPNTQSRNSEYFNAFMRKVERLESRFNKVQNLDSNQKQVCLKTAMELSLDPYLNAGDMDSGIGDMIAPVDIEDIDELTELVQSWHPTGNSSFKEQQSTPESLHNDLIVTSKKLSEHEVLRELLFAFHGIEGTLFKINPDCVDLYISAELQNCMSTYPLVAHLAELGTLHLKVLQFLRSVPQVGAPPCVTALITSMQSRLRRFSQFVACLEKKLVSDEYEHKPTLLRLKIRIAKSMHEMHWLAIVAETCKNKKGGAILSVLDGLMNHGNPQVQKYLKPIFVAVAEVYYTMLGNWLKASEFYDPNCEFFIGRAVDSSQAKLFWKRNYYCIRNESGLPPTYISRRQAKEVLDAGWNIALLQKILGKCDILESWNKIDTAIDIAIHSEVGHLAWREDGEMHSCVQKLLHESSTHVVQALLNQGKLQLHLNAIVGHFLLMQKLFAKEFIRRLSPVLDMPASKVNRSSLKLQLDEVIQFCNFPIKELNILQNIKVELSQINEPSSTGWDIFNLNYEVDPEDPISLVISKTAINKYQYLFKQLLRTKEIERILANMELATRKQYKGLHFKKDAAANIVHCMRKLILEMSAVLKHTHDFQIIYTNQQWQNFQVELTKATNITNLVNSHDKFISSVMQFITLDNENHGIKVHLLRLHDLALSLQNLCTKLCSLKLVNTGDAQTLKEDFKILHSIQRKVFALTINFDKWMTSFLTVLKESCIELQNLGMVINYSAYYKELF